jgi:hypothetical protein
MSEPIYLYNADGESLAVYTHAQAEVLLAAGEWFASVGDAKAGKVRSEPTPTMSEKLDALEGGAGPVADDVTDSPAPAGPRKVSKGKGKL